MLRHQGYLEFVDGQLTETAFSAVRHRTSCRAFLIDYEDICAGLRNPGIV